MSESGWQIFFFYIADKSKKIKIMGKRRRKMCDLTTCECSNCVMYRDMRKFAREFYRSCAGKFLAIDYLHSCELTIRNQFNRWKDARIPLIARIEFDAENERRADAYV